MTPVLAFEEIRFPLELFCAMFLFLVPFAKKKSYWAARCALAVLFSCAFSLLYFPIFVSKDAPRFPYLIGLWYPFIAVMPVIFAKLSCLIGWCDALFLGIASFAAQNLVYTLLHQYTARRLFPSLREHLVIYLLLCALFCAVIYGLIYHIFASHLAGCGGTLLSDSIRNITFYGFIFVLMISTLFHFQNLFQNFADIFSPSVCLMEVPFCIFILSVEYALFEGANSTKEKAQLEKFLHDTEKYYALSRETIEIINRKCHDMKHQLRVLSTVSDEERQAYIEETQRNIIFYQKMMLCENDVINTILAEKGLLCEEKKIELSCSIDDVKLDFIRVSDLYALLGNAVDNAMEYVAQFDDPAMRVINLRISARRHFISIQVNNPYVGPALPAGVLPATTKGDHGNHGFGLRSIKYIAMQYNGWLELSTENSMFTLQIMIPECKDTSH